jgi:hypothetical protein
MEKTAQQKRFEAAWHIKWPNDEPLIFEQDTKGQYTWTEVQDTFEGWQLCEASALERAAKVCDEQAMTPTTEELKDALIDAAAFLKDAEEKGLQRNARLWRTVQWLAQAELSRRESEVKPARCVCSMRNHDDICSKHVGATNVCGQYLPGIGTCMHSRACHGGAK